METHTLEERSNSNSPLSVYLERMLKEKEQDLASFSEKYLIRLTPEQIEALKNASKFEDQFTELNNKPRGYGMNFTLLWNELLYLFSNKDYGIPNINVYDRFFGVMVEMLPTFILKRLKGLVNKELGRRKNPNYSSKIQLRQPELPSSYHNLMDKLINRYE